MPKWCAGSRRPALIFFRELNLHEFADGGTSAVTYCRPVHNPWNPALTGIDANIQ
jgi:Asp-tRNA(Asn)/Glu-tRNA(Gln) amidotransferase A subunit family amidase